MGNGSWPPKRSLNALPSRATRKRRRALPRSLALVVACGLLGLGAASLIAPKLERTLALMGSTATGASFAYGVVGSGQLLQVEPPSVNLGDLPEGTLHDGQHLLTIVKDGDPALPLTASIAGAIAQYVSVALAQDGSKTSVLGDVYTPTVSAESSYNGTITITIGNDFDSVSIPATLTVHPTGNGTTGGGTSADPVTEGPSTSSSGNSPQGAAPAPPP